MRLRNAPRRAPAVAFGPMGTDSSSPRPRRWPRRVAKVFGALVGVIVVAATGVFAASHQRIHQRFNVQGEQLTIPTDAPSLARGERLARTRGCLECHGERGQGQVFLRAMPVMELHPSNLTPGGRTARWSGSDWTRAVRHCVRPDGTGIPFMPCGDYRFLDDTDLGQIVAYLRSLPATSNDPGPSVIGPIGRVLFLKGDLPYLVAETIDHRAPVPSAPPAGPTVEYGRYLAAACTGCHGEHYSGGHIPGTPPDWPPAANITTDPATGIAAMTEEQFMAVLNTGRARDGHTISAMHMPWRQLAQLTDEEKQALWRFVRTIPPRPAGTR